MYSIVMADSPISPASATALNLIGAATLLIADELTTAVEEESGLAAISAAALVSIAHAPGEPIDYIARSLRRSHSAVVRLVAALVEQGYVEKRASSDARAVSLELTRSGRQTVRRVLARREAVLRTLIQPLSAAERSRLESISRRLIESHTTDELQAMWVCRFCDGEKCDPCPMATLRDGESP